MSIFPTVYMHIRSPAIDTVADSIFYIATDGGAYISDYISTYSYGRRSPCFEHDRNNAGYFIFSTGHVFGNWEVTVTDSYGSPGTVPIPVSLIWVTSSGNTDSFGGLSYSYGYGIDSLSGTGGFDANYAWNVDRSGNIPLFSDHGTSYGFALRARIVIILHGM